MNARLRKIKGTEYDVAKDATAFTLLAMSDDEDHPNHKEGSEKNI